MIINKLYRKFIRQSIGCRAKVLLSEVEGQNRNLIQFFLWTGLRASELVALNWIDVDWLRGEIDISKVLTQSSKKFEVPKTSAGKRKVKLLMPALAALENQKQFTIAKHLEIFQNPRTLERWTGDQSIRKTVWHPALKKLVLDTADLIKHAILMLA